MESTFGDEIKFGATEKKHHPSPMCQWPNCNYFAVSRIQRGLTGYKAYICTIHRERFRALHNDIVHRIRWQRIRYRYYG